MLGHYSRFGWNRRFIFSNHATKARQSCKQIDIESVLIFPFSWAVLSLLSRSRTGRETLNQEIIPPQQLSFQNHSIFLRTALLVRNLLLKRSSSGGSLQKTCLGIPTRKSRLIAFSVTNVYAFVMAMRVGSENQRRFQHFLIHLKSLPALPRKSCRNM